MKARTIRLVAKQEFGNECQCQCHFETPPPGGTGTALGSGRTFRRKRISLKASQRRTVAITSKFATKPDSQAP